MLCQLYALRRGKQVNFMTPRAIRKSCIVSTHFLELLCELNSIQYCAVFQQKLFLFSFVDASPCLSKNTFCHRHMECIHCQSHLR